MSRDTATVILSGSADSVLAACAVIEGGYSALPVLCNNGHVERIERVEADVKALQKVYGTDRVADLQVIDTEDLFYSYMDDWCNNQNELNKRYPGLQLHQVHCLSCKAAILAGALRFCREHGINHLVDGMRMARGLCVDTVEMRTRIEEVCGSFGVVFLAPIYDIEKASESLDRLAERGVLVEAEDSECFLGVLRTLPKEPETRSMLLRFFDNELREYIMSGLR